MLLLIRSQFRLGVKLVKEGGVSKMEVGQRNIGGGVKLAARDIEEAIGEVEVWSVWWGMLHGVVTVIKVRH